MKRSGIITLMTDFGLADPYVAMMKGVILSINPRARLVDISHHIIAGSILQAAGVIQETFSFFPEGTVHVAVVDPGVGSDRSPDNGVFWPLIADYGENRVIHITERRYLLPHVTRTFHGRDVFAPIAAHLSLGVDPGQMGLEIKDTMELSLPKAHEREEMLHGQVVRVDNFGNLITNISHQELERFLKESKPFIHIGNLEIKDLNNIYSDVEKGEPLAFVNSSGMLEVAINLGRAADYVGIDPGEIVGAAVKVGRYE